MTTKTRKLPICIESSSKVKIHWNRSKKPLVFLVCLFVVGLGYGQNLVPNPSFEDTVYCPNSLADISATTFWNSPTQGSPDFFHTCNGGSAGIPDNTFGSQFAQDGSAYIGISVYDSQNTYSYREYIQAPLTQTLSAGQKYWVCFFVSLADTCQFAIKDIGVHFSDQMINSTIDTTLSLVPQIEFTDSIITDKTGWVKIKGEFIAGGTENYILLGNFNRKQTTTSIQVNNNNTDPYAYYYIDYVCVSADSMLCSNSAGVNDKSIEPFITVFPNPFSEIIRIKKVNASEPYDLCIFDSMGQIVFEQKHITESLKEVDAHHFNNNVLYVSVKTHNQCFHYKLVKS